MYPDFNELLSALYAHRVKYLVVGAYAVSVHAQPRATKDPDILVKPGVGNASAVFAALTQFGAPLEGMTSADFAVSAYFFAWDANRSPSTFFRRFRKSISTRHGSAALKM